MSTRRRALAAAAGLRLALALPRPLLAAGPAPAALDVPSDYIGYVSVPRYFAETQHNVDGAFLTYFRANGEVDVFGFPLTEQFWEPSSALGGAGRMVQYFQRGRLEFDLVTRTVRRSPLGDAMGRRQPAVPPLPGVRYFPETGHNLGGSFLQFFVDNGGPGVLGLPISEEVSENGHTVQWFQNVRLEWWPENATGEQVQYGLIGDEQLALLADYVPADALQPAPALEPLQQWVLPPAPRPPLRYVAPQRVPILYYHQVPAQGPLREQIRAFKEAGRTFATLGQVVDTLRGEGTLPENPLVLSFDDSWASQLANAAPVLQAEQVTATFFVITRFLGNVPGYLTWDQVRAIKELGHEVESHTQNHASLADLRAENEGAAIAEIWESLAILEDRLGHSRRILAYPNGQWDQGVVNLTARVYRAAVATGGGTAQSQDRLYTLRRIKAEPSYKPESLLQQM